MNAAAHENLRQAFGSHERFLWGLCYRMTGSAADADDLVQDTFVRVIERPPGRVDDQLRPWLTQVAMNLSRDHLRRRRRTPYKGVWLPAPVETAEEEPLPGYEPSLDGQLSTEGRYDLMESVSYAFLLALEALTPAQRAVLLLRDVFDYSVRETSDALGMSEANVKTTHHRARTAMREYEARRCLPTPETRQRHLQVLGQFVTSLAAQDVPAIEALLVDGVVAFSDGGGKYLAALNPIRGRSRVLRLYIKLAQHRPIANLAVCNLNGVPGLVVDFDDRLPRMAPRMTMSCEVDERGKITALYAVVAPRKLAGLRSA